MRPLAVSSLPLLVLLVVVLPACGAAQPTAVPPLPTWPTIRANPGPGETWLYVALGDTNPLGAFAAGQSYVYGYARYIEADWV